MIVLQSGKQPFVARSKRFPSSGSQVNRAELLATSADDAEAPGLGKLNCVVIICRISSAKLYDNPRSARNVRSSRRALILRETASDHVEIESI